MRWSRLVVLIGALGAWPAVAGASEAHCATAQSQPPVVESAVPADEIGPVPPVADRPCTDCTPTGCRIATCAGLGLVVPDVAVPISAGRLASPAFLHPHLAVSPGAPPPTPPPNLTLSHV